MRIAATAALAGAVLALVACSKPTQDKTAQDLKAVGGEVKDAAHQVADTPAAKDLGSDIKQGASEAGDKLKAGASEAGDKLKAGASDAGDKLKEGAKDAGAKTDKALNDAKDKAQNH